jgi:predicted nucleic acid-binding protein
MMVVIDTTVWIDYLRGAENPETRWLERELFRQRLGLTDLILCEVLPGIPDRFLFSQVRDKLLKFQIFPTGGTDLAIAAVENYQFLRRHGFTVRRTIDCVIATHCLQDGHQLLHTTILIPSRKCWVCKSCMRDGVLRTTELRPGRADEACPQRGPD